MSPMSPNALRNAFNPSVFEAVRKLWFQNAADETQLMLPPQELSKQWFTSDVAFDKLCLDAFREQLSIIESGVVTADDILNAATPQTPLDWLSLVLLLDQVPRNCYRGPVAKTAFTVFDPIALAITLRAIENGIPEIPPIRYYAGYRLWFYLPLQHSEEPKIHELSMRENARIFTDIKALVDGPDTIAEGNNSMKYCRNFLSENRDGIERWETMLLSFASRHKVIIDRFGRYPHRNEAMGRKSTEEELKYLAEGGETFTSGH